MKCLLDLDGVLVDFVRGSCRLHNRPNPYYTGHTSFDINEAWDMSAAEFFERMDRKFWSNLDWTEDGRSMFSALHNHFGPKNICILTSPILTDGCIDGKMDWIKANLPKAYHRQVMIGSAKEFMAHSNSVLVDDRDENVIKFAEAGGGTILVPRPWNAGRSNKLSALQHLNESLNGVLSSRIA